MSIVPAASSSPIIVPTDSEDVETQDFMVCFVNGKKYTLHAKDIQPESTLLHFLRQTCGLSGTKLVCGEGGCGACTVLVSKLNHATGRVAHHSVNACLYPLGAIDGAHVITVEGIGNPKIGLHPIQTRLAELNGSQCGFCTPGIVMAFYALVRNNPSPTQKEIEHVMDGNLCRCTGYRPILDATKSFAVDRSSACGMGENCCRNKKPSKPIADDCAPSTPHCDGMKLTQTCTCSKIDELNSKTPTAPLPQAFREDSALIFPPFLMKYQPKRIVLTTDHTTWTKPSNLPELLRMKAEYPDAKLVCGNSEAGIDMKFRFDSRPWKQMVYCSDIRELVHLTESDVGLTVGASVTIGGLQSHIQTNLAKYDVASQSLAHAILTQIHWFAGTQIRNVATLAGNVVTASPISDLNPVWQATKGVEMLVASVDGTRIIPGAAFFTGYRQTAMTPKEVLVQVFMPLRKATSPPVTADVSPIYTHAYKQSRRRADDIAIVTSCMQMSVAKVDNQLVFDHVSLSYGGMAPSTKLASITAASLVGKPVTIETIKSAALGLKQDFPLLDAKVLPGGMAEYRMVLAASFLMKMYFYLWKSLRLAGGSIGELMPEFPADHESAVAEYEREVSSGTQTYRVREVIDLPLPPSGGQAHAAAAESSGDSHAASSGMKLPEQRNLVGDAAVHRPAQSGEPIRHLSALKQATGEAKYVDDLPLTRDEQYVGLVLSTEPHARILSIDTSLVESHPGFGGFFTHADIPGDNAIGDIIHDEECFAREKVVCVGTVIGAVIGRTQIEATQLSRMVKVTYEKLTPILSIDDAIAANSYVAPWQDGHTLIQGDVDAALAAAPNTLSGESRIGGQEHYYLESSACIVTPGEDDTIHIIGTTQNPNKTQQYVAGVLGIGAHKVVVQVKRMGGGFGGKETRTLHIIAAAAVAAYKSRRTLRLVLDHDTDMAITGQRHAFMSRWKVGFDNDGRILGVDAMLYANAGCSADLTMPVVDRALLHFENAYRYGALRVTGKPCLTNLPSNTAFRGFGGPQGMYMAECIVDAIAQTLSKKPEEVRQINLYQQGDVTPFKQTLKEYTVPQQWDHIIRHVDLPARRAAVAAFNATNRYKKRGLALIPTKFGIAFTAKFLNQAGALVLVYSDGTILINCGATEIGQGIYTKMCQVAATAFGVPLHMVAISDTSTDKVANASPTAASATSDLNGAAILDACHQIIKRLEPLRAKHPNKTWPEICSMAYFERIQLTATGFYATPDVGYDFVKAEGQPFNYFTTGVCYSEVEVDLLTGDFTTLQSHIVMDVGLPINPTIDIGQIEGAFVQGVGLFTIEELVWGDSEHPWVRPGHLQTRGPGTYKLPSSNDIPINLHVELWKGGQNSRAIFSSKGVGEPPLFMGSSVFFAIKDALHSARHATLSPDRAATPFVLHSPATAERIRMAAADEITKEFMKPGTQPGEEVTFQPKGSF